MFGFFSKKNYDSFPPLFLLPSFSAFLPFFYSSFLPPCFMGTSYFCFCCCFYFSSLQRNRFSVKQNKRSVWGLTTPEPILLKVGLKEQTCIFRARALSMCEFTAPRLLFLIGGMCKGGEKTSEQQSFSWCLALLWGLSLRHTCRKACILLCELALQL